MTYLYLTLRDKAMQNGEGWPLYHTFFDLHLAPTLYNTEWVPEWTSRGAEENNPIACS
jgi:hypothetical protein